MDKKRCFLESWIVEPGFQKRGGIFRYIERWGNNNGHVNIGFLKQYFI